MHTNSARPTRLTRSLFAASVIGCLFTASPCAADDVQTNGFFSRGNYEVSVGNGCLFSPFLATAHRPTVNYTLTELQLGYMINDVTGDGWRRGNWELAGSGFGGAIFEGDGNYVAGVTAWLRYNFVPRHSRIVPYLQGGTGLALTDTDRGLVGQNLNFNLDLGAGARFFITPRWSINLEYRYQHISNANLAQRDHGINANGPILAVSCFF